MEANLQNVSAILLPILVVVLWQYTRKANVFPRNLPCPPGPKPLPFLGNLRDMPSGAQWLGYNELSKKYGMSQ